MVRCCICSPPHSPRTPDSAWSWLVCFSGGLSFALGIGMLQCYAIVMPVFMDYFTESRETTAWAGSLAAGLVFFSMPLSTMVMTRLNIRYTAILGILMCITSLVVTSFITNIIQLFFSYSILYGLGLSLVFSSCIFATTKYFHKRQAVAIGIVTGGANIGVLSLGPIVQLLIDWYSFRTMYRIMAGSFVLPLLAVCSFDPNVKDPAAEHSNNEHQQDKWNWSMVPKIFKRPMYVVATTTVTLQAMCAFVSFVHLVSYCLDVGISADRASKLFTGIGVSSLVSGVVSGRVMDHKGVNPLHVNQVGALSMGLATVVLQLSSSYILFVFFSVFLGFGIGVFNTTVIMLLLRTVEPRLTLYSFPIGQMITALGNFTGPPLVGFIADKTGSYEPAFYTAGAILLLSFVLPFLQYYFKPWEMDKQPTQIESKETPERRDVQEDRQNADGIEAIALELVNEKHRENDNSIVVSYVNPGIEGDDVTGQDNCQQDTDIEGGLDNQGLQPETAMQDDGIDTKL